MDFLSQIDIQFLAHMLDEAMLDKGRFSRREFGSAVEELVSVFGESAVFDPYSGFQPTQLSFSQAFSVLNRHVFGGKAGMPCVEIIPIEEMVRQSRPGRQFAARFEYSCEAVDASGGLIVRESPRAPDRILVVAGSAFPFMFSVSALCHEMIHKVDADSGVLRFGGWLDGELEGAFGKGLAFDEHRTPVFKKYMAASRDQGIYVMREAYDRAGQTRRPSEYAKGFMEKLVGESMSENEIAKTRILHLLYSSISDESDMTFSVKPLGNGVFRVTARM